MATLEEFKLGELKNAFGRIVGVLQDHAEALDSLDIDGEPGAGSDISATMAAASEAAREERDLVGFTSRLAAGARQTSRTDAGRALVSLLTGFAEVAGGVDDFDAQRFALVVEIAAENLQDSAGQIEPGGVRAVVGAVSVGALRAADQGLSLVEVLIAGADEGLDELESGVSANQRLAERGMVDASAASLLLVIDCFAAIASGDDLPVAPVVVHPDLDGECAPLRVTCIAVPLDGDHPDKALGRSWVETCAWLEERWHELGELRRCEIKDSQCSLDLVTSDAGRAIESLCAVGRPTELTITVLSSAES